MHCLTFRDIPTASPVDSSCRESSLQINQRSLGWLPRLFQHGLDVISGLDGCFPAAEIDEVVSRGRLGGSGGFVGRHVYSLARLLSRKDRIYLENLFRLLRRGGGAVNMRINDPLEALLALLSLFGRGLHGAEESRAPLGVFLGAGSSLFTLAVFNLCLLVGGDLVVPLVDGLCCQLP